MRQSFGNMPVKTKWLQKCKFVHDPELEKLPKAEKVKAPEPSDINTGLPSAVHAAPEPKSRDAELPVSETTGPDPKQLSQEVPTATRRSGRIRRPVQRFIAAFVTVALLTVPHQTMCTPLEEFDEDMHNSPLLAFAASADPDTMYLHQALKEPDKAQWLKAMEEEVNAHISNGNWEMVPRRSVPAGVPVLPAVWAMRRKRRIATREVYKWKARLNLDGSKQVKGVNYQETYAPVAGWSTIRIVLMTAILKNWPTKQIDYVMAYSQADVDNDNMFMNIPKGFEVDSSQAEQWVLKLKKNLYGQKQAGRVWNKHLVTRLKLIGFKQSLIDECLFYRDKIIYVLYIDDSILTGPNKQDLDKVIEEIKGAGLDITVEGDI
jgi:hypothetical protein